MTKRFLRFLRGNTIALLALFVALGGTTYAASTALIGKNTVASPQVVNGSLKTLDLSKKARAALKGNRGLRGLRGLAGPRGLTGAQGLKGDTGIKGDTGSRGPSDVFSVFKNGRTGIADTGTTVATMPGLAAGNYAINAKAWVDTSSGLVRAVTCVLKAEGDNDTAVTRLDNSGGVVTRATIALQVVHVASGAFSVTLSCSNDGGGSINVIGINDIKITAIKVDSLANNPAS
jgi:hypothetical protein